MCNTKVFDTRADAGNSLRIGRRSNRGVQAHGGAREQVFQQSASSRQQTLSRQRSALSHQRSARRDPQAPPSSYIPLLQAPPEVRGHPDAEIGDEDPDNLPFSQISVEPEELAVNFTQIQGDDPQRRRFATAIVLRLIWASILVLERNNLVIVGDSAFSCVEIVEVLLLMNILYLGHVRHMFRQFPKDKLDTHRGDYELLQSFRTSRVVYALRRRVDAYTNTDVYMVSSIDSQGDSTGTGRVDTAIYRMNSHAVDDNNQVRTYINTETSTVFKDYRLKHIMGLFGLCLTNAYEYFQYEYGCVYNQTRSNIKSDDFAMLVAKHLLQNKFGAPLHIYESVEKTTSLKTTKRVCVSCKTYRATQVCTSARLGINTLPSVLGPYVLNVLENMKKIK